MLTAGIVGLPNAGKSTLFNAITKANALQGNYPFTTIEPNVGVVEVDDERLNEIVKRVNPRKVVRATVSFTDIAGLVAGASHGEGLGNQFLGHIREVTAICHVVRCFTGHNVAKVGDTNDPVADVEIVNTELLLADLDAAGKRMEKVAKKAKMEPKSADNAEYQVLLKLKTGLEKGIMAYELGFNSREKEILKPFGFLTLKPMIYVLNIDEKDINQETEAERKIKEYAKMHHAETVRICAQLEADLNEFSLAEKELFLQEAGLKTCGLANLILKAYSLLGLATFFTEGEKECRAWTFKKGMTAAECAGLVHSDFARGFIRAEIISYDDFIAYGSWNKAKDAGRMRSEGKTYSVKDGDMIIFRFNVTK